MGFPMQDYWSGLLIPPSEDLPNPGTEPASLAYPALASEFSTTAPLGKSLLPFTTLIAKCLGAVLFWFILFGIHTDFLIL